MATVRETIHKIAGMPRAEIEADLRDIQTDRLRVATDMQRLARELDELNFEEELLTRVLKMGPEVEQGSSSDEAMVAAESADQVSFTQRPKLRRGAVSEGVLEIVTEFQPRRMSPADIRQELAERGIDADSNAVRVALRRWADRGEIAKFGDGTYSRGVASQPTEDYAVGALNGMPVPENRERFESGGMTFIRRDPGEI